MLLRYKLHIFCLNFYGKISKIKKKQYGLAKIYKNNFKIKFFSFCLICVIACSYLEGDRIITVSIRQRFLKEGQVFDLNSAIHLTERTTQQQQNLDIKLDTKQLTSTTTKSKYKKRNYKNHVQIAAEYGSLRWLFWTSVNYILWVFSYFWLWFRGDEDAELPKNSSDKNANSNDNKFLYQQNVPIMLTTQQQQKQNLIQETDINTNKRSKRKAGKATTNKLLVNNNVLLQQESRTANSMRQRNSSETTNSGSWNQSKNNNNNPIIDWTETNELLAKAW